MKNIALLKNVEKNCQILIKIEKDSYNTGLGGALGYSERWVELVHLSGIPEEGILPKLLKINDIIFSQTPFKTKKYTQSI